jgi:hypothetical protein
MSIPRAKVMHELVAPFTVQARLTGEEYKVRFSHLWGAIATRHSDTIDCKFLVNGRGVIVALAHAGLVEVRRRLGRSLNDHETAALASLYLQESLEADRDSGNQTRFVPRTEVERLATALGLLPAN